jgi:predicted nucleic acid-binding protein
MDTGPLVALMVDTDPHHKACLDWLAEVARRGRCVVIPLPVLTEVSMFLENLGATHLEARFLRGLVERPELFKLYSPGRAELARIAELVERYAGWPLGTPDASVVATAEHFGITTVCTLDQRHFRAVVPQHCDYFDIVP